MESGYILPGVSGVLYYRGSRIY